MWAAASGWVTSRSCSDWPQLRPPSPTSKLYSGVSAGTELTAYRGSNVYLNKRWDADRRLFVPEQPSVAYPLTGWGYSEVGRVVEIGGGGDSTGPGSRPVSVGDVVHGVWGHRSEAVLPAGALTGRALPPGLDPIVRVFVRVGAVALNAVLAADLHLTESVVVMGRASSACWRRGWPCSAARRCWRWTVSSGDAPLPNGSVRPTLSTRRREARSPRGSGR